MISLTLFVGMQLEIRERAWNILLAFLHNFETCLVRLSLPVMALNSFLICCAFYDTVFSFFFDLNKRLDFS